MNLTEQKIADAIKARRFYTDGTTDVLESAIDPASLLVHFHGNQIARIEPDRVTLSANGVFKPTVKSRLNTILWALDSPVHIIQHKHQWRLDGGLYHSEPFTDGVVIAI